MIRVQVWELCTKVIQGNLNLPFQFKGTKLSNIDFMELIFGEKVGINAKKLQDKITH